MATESNIDSKNRCRSSTGWSPPACSEAIGGGEAGRCRPLGWGSNDGEGGGGGAGAGGGGAGAAVGGSPATEEEVSGATGIGGSRAGAGPSPASAAAWRGWEPGAGGPGNNGVPTGSRT